MPVEKTERDITTLMGEISRQEMKLPIRTSSSSADSAPSYRLTNQI